jgi:Spy/CpxP family protein refolding chaperone
MRKRLNLILVAALAIALGAGAVAYAGHGGKCEGHGPFGQVLTEEQRAEIHSMVTEMRDAGAAPEEIHAAVREKMESYGIEVPEDVRGRHPRHEIFSQLSEEQREAIHAKMAELREAGASPDGIHAAIKEMLEGFGIEVPENFRAHHPRHEIFSQLTHEQREAVHAKVREMRQAGASRDEIHAAVREMLKGFGIEMPEIGDAVSPLPLGESQGQGVRWGKIKGEFR